MRKTQTTDLLVSTKTNAEVKIIENCQNLHLKSDSSVILNSSGKILCV
jgi:hypothetical protein